MQRRQQVALYDVCPFRPMCCYFKLKILLMNFPFSVLNVCLSIYKSQDKPEVYMALSGAEFFFKKQCCI